ncbi:MAG TPA: carbon-nitrogen hydrolase family protein [Ramlibacter sp.]
MKVAAIQMVSGTTVAGNLDSARTLLEEAARAGAELAVLPEYFCLLGQRDTDKLAVRERFGDGPIQEFLRDAARELKMAIVGGTLPLHAGDDAHVRNTSLAFSRDGALLARYDKVHLFRFDNGRERYDESRVIEAGAHAAAFDLASRDGRTWRIGMSVCYDLRFPELYRQLQAEVILVPSAFTYVTGQAHWELLLRARAVENLAFVVAPAQGGTHENGRRTWGHTMVVDPWGDVIGVRGSGAGVVLAEIDTARLAEVRKQLPALEHRVL